MLWPFDQLNRIEAKLDAILLGAGYETSILKASADKLKSVVASHKLFKENEMATPLDALTAQVTATVGAEASAVTLINGLAAALKAAGTDPVKLADLQS